MIQLSNGSLSAETVDMLLKSLPLELTYTDENDLIQYYSDIPDPIFPREPSLLGSSVIDCHNESKPEVIKLLNDFKAGRRDKYISTSDKEGKEILIMYLAIRDKDGNYKGCLEVTQDVTKIVKQDYYSD